MMKKIWIVGTRGSKLALRQTEIVIGRLATLYPDAQFIAKIIKTTGDTIWDKPLHLIGGKGLFVKEIEEALLAGEIDMAVHSMKDMPVELPEGLTLGATLERENPRDVFISIKHQRLSDVRPGGKIGTGSLRRKAQLLSLNKRIEVVPPERQCGYAPPKAARAEPGRNYSRLRRRKAHGLWRADHRDPVLRYYGPSFRTRRHRH
jgi:hydroxymethylbilane synthase